VIKNVKIAGAGAESTITIKNKHMFDRKNVLFLGLVELFIDEFNELTNVERGDRECDDRFASVLKTQKILKIITNIAQKNVQKSTLNRT